MTIPFVPHAFVDGENVDLEKINDNLERIYADVQRNIDLRYTYSHFTLMLDGVADTDAQVLRELAIRRLTSSGAIEVIGRELVIYATAGVTWTLTCSDSTCPDMTLTTAGTTTEAHTSSGVPVSVTSASTDLRFTLSGGAASTIVRGYLVVHLRCDRGNQGTSHVVSFPTLLTSATTGIAAALDAELTALAGGVTRDTANQDDLRCECFAVRGLAAGSSVTFRAPSGVRNPYIMRAYTVAAVGCDAVFTYNSAGATPALTVTATGATARATGQVTLSDANPNDDPMDATDDATIEIAASGVGTSLLSYVLIFYN